MCEHAAVPSTSDIRIFVDIGSRAGHSKTSATGNDDVQMVEGRAEARTGPYNSSNSAAVATAEHVEGRTHQPNGSSSSSSEAGARVERRCESSHVCGDAMVGGAEAVDSDACKARTRKEKCEPTARGRQQFSHDSRGRALVILLSDTYEEVPEEDETEEGRVWGQRVKTMYGTRQSASTWQEEVQRAMCEVNIVPGTSFLCMFHFDEVDGSSLVDEEDFVTIHQKSWSALTWDVEVQTVGPGLANSTMSVLKRNPLSWSTQTQKQIDSHNGFILSISLARWQQHVPGMKFLKVSETSSQALNSGGCVVDRWRPLHQHVWWKDTKNERHCTESRTHMKPVTWMKDALGAARTG